MERFLNPHACSWDGPDADCRPDSDFIPWSRVPERKITVEDIKYLLSSYYQGTPFDPYANSGDSSLRGKYRPIGINRNDFLALIQIRSDVPEAYRVVEWVAFGSNAFNAMKAATAGYLQVLFDQNPKSVGGKLPGDDFYYGAN